MDEVSGDIADGVTVSGDNDRIGNRDKSGQVSGEDVGGAGGADMVEGGVAK